MSPSPAELTAPAAGAVARLLAEFEIGEELGRGGGGVVLAATRRSTGEHLAVKALTGAANPWAYAQLRAEADALSACDHPNLLRCHGFSEGEGVAVLALERAPSETVLDRLRGTGVPFPAACAVLVAVGRALQHLHDQGWLHGDVQPQNVLFDPGGRHRLVDLGLARRWPFAVDAPVAGSPRYLAPEAIVPGGHLVPATDVYALGVTAFELLSGGQLPFLFGDDPRAVLRLHLRARPLPLRAVAPDVPPALGDLVAAALHKDPAERVASAAAFADAVAAFVPDRTEEAVP